MMKNMPLKPAVFHILLALSEEERHGLGIADEVEALTEGAMKLGPGTLYRSLKLMAKDGLVRPVSHPGADEDPRRKHYRMTKKGREALEEEAARFERVVRAARRNKVLPVSS